MLSMIDPIGCVVLVIIGAAIIGIARMCVDRALAFFRGAGRKHRKSAVSL
jgi:hypothetical protein